MISRLEYDNFKCFESLRLPLAPLTLLSGSNASGKSSALQGLVLLHQTMREHEWSNRLMLNGRTIRLGSVSDVVDKVHGRRSFSIGVEYAGDTYSWTFGGDRADMSFAVEEVKAFRAVYPSPEELRYLLPLAALDRTEAQALAQRVRKLTYITAERVGPRDVYSLEDVEVASVVGPAGEHSVSMLHWGRDEIVVDELVLATAPPTRLRQVEARMAVLFPGCTLAVQQVPNANAVTLGLRNSVDTDFHRPIHAGFGLTQVFPIVVAALSCHPGDVMLLENPEVHLHPAGQSLMGGFLAQVAAAGIQVIVETHSDHVLNGVRRAVKSGHLPPADTAIHFFQKRSEPGAQVVTPLIDEDGNLSEWPAGFFDQFDKDMNYFAGWEA